MGLEATAVCDADTLLVLEEVRVLVEGETGCEDEDAKVIWEDKEAFVAVVLLVLLVKMEEKVLDALGADKALVVDAEEVTSDAGFT